MGRVLFSEHKYYLGNVGHSMQHLPRWYQITCLCGVFFVIYLRSNPVITWLVEQLHSSFGTELLWHPEYQVLLKQMTFNERLSFTLYGVSLGLVVLVVFKLFCRDTYGLGVSATQLFPDRKGKFAVVFCAMGVIEAVRLRKNIAECLSEPGSLANLALHHFEGIENTTFDAHFVGSNPHFIIQLEVLKSVLMSFVLRKTPIVLLAALYRLSRDVPQKEHVSLRWYLATYACVSFVSEAVYTYVNSDWTNPLPVAQILWIIFYLGMINYTYGPSKRAGTVVTVSRSQSIKVALRCLSTCYFMWFVVGAFVITVVVSVHVVELIVVWVGISLLLLWTPAIIDSGSLGYATSITTVMSYIACAMGYVSPRGSVRFGLIFLLWWVNVFMMYNVVVSTTASRKVGLGVLVWIVLYVFSPRQLGRDDVVAVGDPQVRIHAQPVHSSPSSPSSSATSFGEMLPTGENSGIILLLGERLRWLVNVAELKPLPPHSWYAQDSLRDVEAPMEQVMRNGIVSFCVLSGAALAVVRIFGKERLDQLRVRHIPVLTPQVMLRKGIRSLVLLGCTVSSIAFGYFFKAFFLPRIAHFLPDILAKAMSGLVACAVLGLLMDMKDSMYTFIIRLLGLMDPPRHGVNSDDDEEDEEEEVPQPNLTMPLHS